LWSFDFKDNLAPTLPTKPPFGNGSKSSVAEDVHPSVNVTISDFAAAAVDVVVSLPPKTEARAVLSFPRPESASEEEEKEDEEDKAATPKIVPIITDFVAQECVKESL